MSSTDFDARAKWQAAGAGERYAHARFRSRSASERDPKCVALLLDQLFGDRIVERALDAPCGSGRLSPLLSARAREYVGADVSPSMLAALQPRLAELGPRARALLADAHALPFADASFDVVVACRWLHHLHDEQALRTALSELVRVSREAVIASFWDECSLPGWRQRLGWKQGEGPSGRSATTRERVARGLRAAGAEVVAWRATFRFVSQQSFVAARVRRAAR